MQTFAQKQNHPQTAGRFSFAGTNTTTPGLYHAEHLNVRLHRAIGNQAMQRMLQALVIEPDIGLNTESSIIQTKLTINQPGDEYEQEADRISEQVMRMPQFQRACACGGGCTGCQAKLLGKEDEIVQRQTKPVQTSGEQKTGTPSIVYDELHSSGHPLDSSVRSYFEPRFSYDFNQVRVHTGSKASESASAMNALAYTVGHDIVFGPGQYEPGTAEGKRLLAHELTHVIQQDAKTLHLQRAVACESGEACPTRLPGELTRSRSTPMQVEIDQSASSFTVVIFNFAINEAGVKSDLSSNPVWSTLLGTMDPTATGQWEILGYTDCEGAERLNQALRQNRAAQVASMLPPAALAHVSLVDADSLTNCITNNATESDRSHNRAVIIRRLPGSAGPTAPGSSAPIGPIKPPRTPALFCVPYPTGTVGNLVAQADRSFLETIYLPFAQLQFGSEVHKLWRDYLSRPKGSSLTPRIFRGSGNVIVDAFRIDPATTVELGLLEAEIKTVARAIPEANIPFTGITYTSPPIGLGTLLPITSLERTINYTDGHIRIPGNIAGGSGARGTSASDAGPDLRLFTGEVLIERTHSGGATSRTAHVTLQLQVIDTIDFCPGAPGRAIAREVTIPMSRLEATPRETTYDLPFHVFVDFSLHIPL